MASSIALSREAASAPSSGIVAVATHAGRRADIIPLWAGEGDQPTPGFITRAAQASLEAGETFYMPEPGIPALREALAGYTAGLYGGPAAPERIFVTGSGMQAIQIALAATTSPGDSVVYFGPAWPNFPAAAGLRGVEGREVALDFDESGWRLDVDRVAAAIGPTTRVLFVNSPANPTGWTADPETLSALLDLARRHGLTIIADEIYGRFVYDGARAPSFHDVAAPEDPVIYVNSLSKNWAMTGWRVGWIEADAALAPAICALVQYSTSGVATFVQRGAVAAVTEGEPFVAEQVARASEARRILTDRLMATGRIAMAPAAGAFYAFFAIDGVSDTRAAAFRIVDDTGVALAPGTAFGPVAPGFMRACFHRRLDHVEAAADRLGRWIESGGTA